MAEGNGATVGEVRVAEVEDALGRIPSVTAARVVTGPGGRVTEVHVLSGRDRSPKQLVRDIQSVAMARFGLEIDYRTVSIVQLEDPPSLSRSQPATEPAVEPPAPTPAPAPAAAPEAVGGLAAPSANARAQLVAVGTEVTGAATEARVRVRIGIEDRVGRALGPADARNVLIGRAVIDALEPMLDGTVVDVASAEVTSAGGRRLALCLVHTAAARGDLTVAGAAVVRRDEPEAIARAALDALNRLVTRDGWPHAAEPDAIEPSPTGETA